jgi:hypothetical protein
VTDELIKRIRRTQADCPDSLAAADLIEQQAALIAELEARIAANGAEPRKVAPEIVIAIQAYGDARADNVEAVSQIANVITLIRQSYAAPVADSAMAKDAEPIWCHACGDGITAHDPGICGTCFAMKYRDAAVAKDAERYRWWRNWVFRAGDDGLPTCTYLADVEDPVDIDAAIDAAIAASASKGGA